MPKTVTIVFKYDIQCDYRILGFTGPDQASGTVVSKGTFSGQQGPATLVVSGYDRYQFQASDFGSKLVDEFPDGADRAIAVLFAQTG